MEKNLSPVVICLKNRTFAVLQTTNGYFLQYNNKL